MADSQYLLKGCSECGGAFRTARAHAQTCSHVCRKRRERRLKMSRESGLEVLKEKVAESEVKNAL